MAIFSVLRCAYVSWALLLLVQKDVGSQALWVHYHCISIISLLEKFCTLFHLWKFI